MTRFPPRSLTWAFLAGVCLLGAAAAAQGPVDPAAPMPPGHPPVGAAPGPVDPAAPMPPGHPPVGAAPGPVDPAAPMPPGHPPLAPGPRGPHPAGGPGGGGTPADGGPDPHGGAAAAPKAEPREDRSAKAPDLRPGTIEVQVRDAFERPVPAARVELGVLFQDPAKGESKKQLDATTGASGVAVFSGLTVDSSHSYRVVVPHGGAAFASEPIRLDVLSGHRVLLHVYPSTADIRRALVGMRGAIYVQPREDVFQIEVNFQVFNIGATAWVPGGLRLSLPDGAKATRAQESMHDARVEKTLAGDLILTGTFGPGQREIGFQFQLDNTGDPSRRFRLAMPPHVAEMRVIAEGPRQMTLDVDGFADAEPTRGQDGARLLVTGRRMGQGNQALEHVEILLAGLPVPSPGRWYAAGLAFVLAGLGLAQLGQGSRGAGARGSVGSRKEAEDAEELVLGELVLLEQLRREERIGPRTYESSRSELLDALARLTARRERVGSP